MVCALRMLLLLLTTLLCFPARTIPSQTPTPSPEYVVTALPTLIPELNRTHTWHTFERFLGAERGSNVSGMSELKNYFRKFGYLSVAGAGNFTDSFDSEFESVLSRYQSKLGLPLTGKLDSATLSQIMAPRCGVKDTSHTHVTKRFAFFPGMPKWSNRKTVLTYGFSPENSVDYLAPAEIQGAFRRAFTRWAAVIPVNFTEIEDFQSADIKIGFYGGDHGDGEPFDGVLGILAHAFSPENGRFHMDTAERWAVDFRSEKSRVAIDLESVATHEIGHILGLAHSSVKEAVMYPSLSPRTRKVNLRADDVEGAQALYGSNPDFKLNALLQSETSTNQGVDSSESSHNNVALGTLVGIFLLVVSTLMR